MGDTYLETLPSARVPRTRWVAFSSLSDAGSERSRVGRLDKMEVWALQGGDGSRTSGSHSEAAEYREV